MSTALSCLEAAQERWPAARREAHHNPAFYPLQQSLFAGLWLGTGLFMDAPIFAGVVLLGAPVLAALVVASVVVVGG